MDVWHDELDYHIRFENDPVFATANAAVVFITVPIDDDINLFLLDSVHWDLEVSSSTYPKTPVFFSNDWIIVRLLGIS